MELPKDSDSEELWRKVLDEFEVKRKEVKINQLVFDGEIEARREFCKQVSGQICKIEKNNVEQWQIARLVCQG